MSYTPAQQCRYAGVLLFLIGVAVAIGNYIGYRVTGSIFIYLLAIPLVCVPSGLYMAITTKNPFEKMKR